MFRKLDRKRPVRIVSAEAEVQAAVVLEAEIEGAEAEIAGVVAEAEVASKFELN